MLLVLTGLSTMQSCTKDNTTFATFVSAVPGGPTPAVDQVVPLSGTSYSLKWEGTASTWDIYIGDTDKPGLAKAGVTGNTYTFTTTNGGEFFWYVTTKDVNKVVSTSPTWNFFINSAPSVPVLKVPATGAVNFSVTGTLKWTSAVDPEGDDVTYDVYLGTTSTPALFAADVADTILAPSLLASTKYYWKVVAKDVHGYSTSSATVGSFTTGLEAIMAYTGNYNADEPAEAYSYDVSFEKATSTTIKTTNYWNSGWTATFTLDLTKLTFSMTSYTFSAGWTGVESGILDPKTGTMTGTYTLWQNGKIAEQGVHTYTKK